MTSKFYYQDKETKEFIEGFPPQVEKYGEAPFVITDTITPYYHPAAQVMVDSRKALMNLDKACGTITTDKKIPPDPTWQREQKKKRHELGVEALKEAVAKIDSGEVNLSEEMKIKCAQRNEQLSEVMKIDAFNVAGRKTDARGKRFRK